MWMFYHFRIKSFKNIINLDNESFNLIFHNFIHSSHTHTLTPPI